jgi:hypothetical protein
MATGTEQSNTSYLKSEQDKLLALPFSSSGQGNIVDIVNDYCWRLDESVTGAATTQDTTLTRADNTPFCYIIERESAVNASIANIANMLTALVGQLDKAVDSGRNLASAVGINMAEGSTGDKVADKIQGGVKGISSMVQNLVAKFDFGKLLAASNLAHDRYFEPYKYLYITKPTGKMFVFPLVNKDSSFGQIKNTWQSAKSLPGAVGEALDTGINYLKTGAVMVNLTDNLTAAFKGESRDVGNITDEVPKTYSYPKDGEAITVNFTLYNTSKVNAWKDNYRFLLLFMLRNLPMRLDAFSFSPPVLYEVVQPGIKRLPICTAETIKINPLGMTRVLKCPNFIDASKELSVNVPEAWDVSITFKSLIPTSANMYLSLLANSKTVSATVSAGEPPATTPSSSESAAATPPTANGEATTSTPAT